MPERPKRRKNKNKRKNKNNRSDNKSLNEVTQLDSGESCSVQVDGEALAKISGDVVDSVVEESVLNVNLSTISRDVPEVVCYSTIEDVNNNSSDNTDLVETLQVPVPSFNNEVAENAQLQGLESYIVESPENSLKSKPKLNNTNKSKSLDNDEATKIVDITEDSTSSQFEDDSALPVVDTSNVIVSDVESDVEWEKTDELEGTTVPTLFDIATGTLSVTTIPFNVAECQQINVSLNPDVEASLRDYLRTLNLSTHPENADSVEIKAEIEHIINREVRHRLRKKGLAEDFGLQRLGPPRMLDVIDEEGSGESSKSSRRQSYLSDKKSENDDLEDDVFEDKNKDQGEMSKKTQAVFQRKTFGRLIPQQCHLVGAKIKEPEVSEARGDWTMQTMEKATGAEIVYLTDSSSSTSSIHEYGDETDDGIETDVSIRMITPTIEVTDTENLLKKTFISNTDNEIISQEKDNNNGHEHNIIEVTQENENQIQENSDVSQSSHEIVVLSTDNINTNLYVKDLEPTQTNIDVITEQNDTFKTENKVINESVEKNVDKYDLEIKVLKCELNDAINNLIKEVSDSEVNENTNNILNRQDSSSSVSSSQCTAKYNPTSTSLNDVSNIMHDDTSNNNKTNAENNNAPSSHVKDVFEHVTRLGKNNTNKSEEATKEPSLLRDLCVKRIASFPYGDKILEELASVSKRLQNFTGAFTTESTSVENHINNEVSSHTGINMPYYPLPDVSSIEKVILPGKVKEPIPPPIQPRNSSLRKKSRDEEVWTGVPTKTEPVYVCLSPSQKMLMEKTHTVITKQDASELVDMHKKYVDRRGYNEPFTKDKLKDDTANDVPPITPFKSQTGSRLLALIRDPKMSGNIDAHSKHRSLDQLEKKLTMPQTSSSKHHIVERISTFRPIPPPRPKKLASSFYESDESSDFTDSSLRSIRNERKFFHFSTGNLNKEIEDDISSIQNMHRYRSNTRDNLSESPRRPSLPQDICDQQMEYIRRKEKEIDAEIQRLESLRNKLPSSLQKIGPKAPLMSEKEVVDENIKDRHNYFISKRRDFFASLGDTERKEKHFNNNNDKGKGKLSSLFSSSQEELFREKMYSEYVTQMAQREERKQHKVIKITNTPVSDCAKISKSLSAIDMSDSKVNNRIEKEFMSKARERWDKLGIKDPDTDNEKDGNNVYREPKVIEHKIKVIESGQERDVRNLPSHLQEFVRFTVNDKEETQSSVVWKAGGTPGVAPAARSPGPPPPPPPPPPVWSPASSPLAARKSYRPVRFDHSRQYGSADHNGCTSGSESEGRLVTSHSAPATGLNTLTSRLPRAQNPTVTLLQKAREGQIPRGSSYLQEEARLPRDRPSPPRTDPVHALRREYASETEADRSDTERPRTMDGHHKVDGIGPTTKEGMPVSLRSEVKDPSKWYKKMYDTIHKNKYDDDYVTIRYKSRRGQPPERVNSNKSQYAYFDPRSGYLSEPEGGLSRVGGNWSDAYDSDATSRRRTASVQEDRRDVTSYGSHKYSTLASAKASQEVYKGQPGRIENYTPGKSSVVDKEAKQQNISSTTSLPQASAKEKKDITSAILSKSNMARALKESGYESDSTLVFRRRDEPDGPLSPAERRAAYRDLQAGGEPPLRGFRSPAPPRQESPHRYVESDVNIHYRCPVRHDPLPLVPEKELARQQAEHMKRLYREQKRNKYLQELQDMQNRRHQDNFTPSQKNILPLNRYDEAERVVAKALYTFTGQTPRELSFRKGDAIHVRRQIDQNWYEGEIHGRIGLFPYNYVEIIKGEATTPKKPTVVEGRARAKFDFTAQTGLELPLKKGEVVVLTRRIDHNWWEGRQGNNTGIFPDSYVTVLQEPSQNKPEPQPASSKPVASPAAHGLMNGSARRSMGAHAYTPQHNSPALANGPPATAPLTGYTTKASPVSQSAAERGYGANATVDLNNTTPLYVDTNAEAVPYRAMYKYRPQNPDELELGEGDTVYVLERCDDGWYVGSSQRTGRFGTFPGNYVERI